MNARERYIRTLTFGEPDRIFYAFGKPRKSTLRARYLRGLPQMSDAGDYGCPAEFWDYMGMDPVPWITLCRPMRRSAVFFTCSSSSDRLPKEDPFPVRMTNQKERPGLVRLKDCGRGTCIWVTMRKKRKDRASRLDRLYQLHTHFDGLDHALRIGSSLTRFSEGNAVVDG